MLILGEALSLFPPYIHNFCGSGAPSGPVDDPQPLPRPSHQFIELVLRQLKGSLENRRDALTEMISFVPKKCSRILLERIWPEMTYVDQARLDGFVSDVSQGIFTMGVLLFSNGNMHGHSTVGTRTFATVQNRVANALCSLIRLTPRDRQGPFLSEELNRDALSVSSLRRSQRIILEKCVLDKSIRQLYDILNVWEGCQVGPLSVQCSLAEVRRRRSCAPLGISRPVDKRFSNK